MTRNRLIALGQERARLIERARGERERLGAQVGRIESAFPWLQVVHKAVNEARRHPLFVVLGVAIVVVLRPRNTLNLLISVLSLWRLYRRGRRVWTLASELASSAAQTQSQ